MVVGLRKEEWTKVLYEPISAPAGLITPDLAPDVGLYSHSRGDATENEPMFGEVAWEPLLNHEYFGSSAKAERCMLQRKILYDAWRYLVARDPVDIAIIREQLEGSHRQRRLLKELDKARKARTNSIRQRDQRRARRAQLLDPNVPAESIENSDDDSGLGSDTDDDGIHNDNEDARRMPPPSHTVRRRGPAARPAFMMSGGLGDTGNRNSNTASASGQTTAGRSAKRKRPLDPEPRRSSHVRSESQGLFMTPPASGRPPRSEQNGEDDDALDVLNGDDANGGLDFDAAMAAARELSLAPGEDGSVWDKNGGLHPKVAESVAMRNSMPPESDAEMRNSRGSWLGGL